MVGFEANKQQQKKVGHNGLEQEVGLKYLDKELTDNWQYLEIFEHGNDIIKAVL